MFPAIRFLLVGVGGQIPKVILFFHSFFSILHPLISKNIFFPMGIAEKVDRQPPILAKFNSSLSLCPLLLNEFLINLVSYIIVRILILLSTNIRLLSATRNHFAL
jgi:hypothetical protein